MEDNYDPAVPLTLDPHSGFLPPGAHPARVEEVRQAFVESFSTSTSRAVIFDMWIHHRTAISSLAPIQRQWLNGSFTTAEVDPRDADVITFLSHTDIDKLAPPEVILLSGLFHGRATRENCRCDSYLVVEYPPGHPEHRRTLRSQAYWLGVFERVRGDDVARKGFAEVIE